MRLCRAADLDDFLDMSIENFACDIISFAICADNRYISGLRPNSNSNLLHKSVNYIGIKEHEGANSSNHIIYIIVKCNIIVSEIRG